MDDETMTQAVEQVSTRTREAIQAEYKDQAALLGDAVYRAWVSLDRMKVLNAEILTLPKS